MSKILVTGGAGFIGSHTCVELVSAGYDILIADNFSNASPKAVERISAITGKNIPCIRAELCNPEETESIFAEHPEKFDPREYLKPARSNIKELVKHKLVDVLGCAGKA